MRSASQLEGAAYTTDSFRLILLEGTGGPVSPMAPGRLCAPVLHPISRRGHQGGDATSAGAQMPVSRARSRVIRRRDLWHLVSVRSLNASRPTHAVELVCRERV